MNSMIKHMGRKQLLCTGSFVFIISFTNNFLSQIFGWKSLVGASLSNLISNLWPSVSLTSFFLWSINSNTWLVMSKLLKTIWAQLLAWKSGVDILLYEFTFVRLLTFLKFGWILMTIEATGCSRYSCTNDFAPTDFEEIWFLTLYFCTKISFIYSFLTKYENLHPQF